MTATGTVTARAEVPEPVVAAATHVMAARLPVAAALLVSGLLVVAVVSRLGMERFDPATFYLTAALRHAGEFTLEPAASVLIPRTTPPITRLFAPLFDVPLAQLVFGLMGKGLVALGLIVLAWRVTGSLLAGAVAAILTFGLADLIVLSVDLPLGTMGHHIRKPVAFSFRLLAMLFPLVATACFLRHRYVAASLWLAVGFYAHPLNMTMFFASFVTALAVARLVQGRGSVGGADVVRLVGPFVLLAVPYIAMTAGLFADVTPMPSAAWWDLLVKNEPDDASVLFHLETRGFVREMGLSLLAALVWVVRRADRPLSGAGLRRALADRRDLVLPMLVAPWVVFAAAAVWEAGLLRVMPDALNDVLIPLHFRRVPTVVSFVYIVVLAAVVADGLVRAARAACDAVGRAAPPVARLDVRLAVAVALALVVFSAARGSSQLGSTAGSLSVAHRGDDLFMLRRDGAVYTPDPPRPGARVIPHAAYVEACAWIRRHTPVSAGVINPSYLDMFMAYADRQGFVTEAEDGNFALFNRRFATLYVQRFADVHGGLTYGELPGPVFNRGPAYGVMRERYLALTDADLARLTARYPGYRYVLTETSHDLPYRRLFTNEYFVLYELPAA